MPSLRSTRIFRALLLGAAMLLMPGCSDSGSEDQASSDVAMAVGGADGAEQLQDSWMYAVVADPELLGQFEQGQSGDGWLAFFNNDLAGARAGFEPTCRPSDAALSARSAAGFPCVGLARTHLESAQFFAEVAQVERVALRQFYRHRQTHPEEVLPSVHQGYFQGVTLLHSGEVARGLDLLRSYSAAVAADPMLKALADRIVAGLAGSDALVQRVWGTRDDVGVDGNFDDLPSSSAAAAYRVRLNFIAAVARGDAASSRALIRPIQVAAADLREELPQKGDGVAIAPVLFHHDPAFLMAMSRLHALDALAAVGAAADLAVLRVDAERLLGRESAAPDSVLGLPGGVALVLFSTVASPADLLGAQRSGAASGPMLGRLAGAFPGLGIEPSTDLSDLDPFVDMSNSARASLAEILKATPGGANMDVDMGLSERFRGAMLLERVRQFQGRFAVRLEAELAKDAGTAGIAARSLLELALDKNPSPQNPQLKRARISSRNDSTLLASLARAQLDTRHPYEANDYIRPLSEVYAELISVREALAALDSAWNPARRGSVR